MHKAPKPANTAPMSHVMGAREAARRWLCVEGSKTDTTLSTCIAAAVATALPVGRAGSAAAAVAAAAR